MTSVMIKIHSLDQIKNLVQALTISPYDIDIASGRYVVDAKSILGIFSLDITKPMELIIHGEVDEAFLKQLEPFIVK